MRGFMERLLRVEEIPYEGVYITSNSGFKIVWSEEGGRGFGLLGMSV